MYQIPYTSPLHIWVSVNNSPTSRLSKRSKHMCDASSSFNGQQISVHTTSASDTRHSSRRPWYPKFRIAINDCHSVDEIEILLCGRVNRWRGKAAKAFSGEEDELEESSDNRENEVIDHTEHAYT